MDPSSRPTGPTGSLRPTSPVVLAVWAILGLVGGWLFHPLSDRWGSPPVVSVSQPLALVVVAAVLGTAAWLTWRAVQVQHLRLAPHQAVNRLVLARASAYVGALVGGGYLGYALSWIGDDAELAHQRVWRAGACAVAGLLIVLAGLALERACRVRGDDDERGGAARGRS